MNSNAETSELVATGDKRMGMEATLRIKHSFRDDHHLDRYAGAHYTLEVPGHPTLQGTIGETRDGLSCTLTSASGDSVMLIGPWTNNHPGRMPAKLPTSIAVGAQLGIFWDARKLRIPLRVEKIA